MQRFLQLFVPVLLVLTVAQTPAGAQDFSAGSKAESWSLYAEVPALFEARVVDALCAIAGDCPADCGGGTRQLVLLRKIDGVMVFPLKNHQPVFSGAANDLQPFCGQEVEVDGLLLDDSDIGARHLFQVQRIRTIGGEWVAAKRWTKDWQAANAALPGKEPWFRRDPRIRAMIAQDGYLGLGADVDAAFIAELFP